MLLQQAVSGALSSLTQQMGGSPMPSPRLASSGPRQPLKPLVHSRAVLQETMREVLHSHLSILWQCMKFKTIKMVLGLVYMLECVDPELIFPQHSQRAAEAKNARVGLTH